MKVIELRYKRQSEVRWASLRRIVITSSQPWKGARMWRRTAFSIAVSLLFLSFFLPDLIFDAEWDHCSCFSFSFFFFYREKSTSHSVSLQWSVSLLQLQLCSHCIWEISIPVVQNVTRTLHFVLYLFLCLIFIHHMLLISPVNMQWSISKSKNMVSQMAVVSLVLLSALLSCKRIPRMQREFSIFLVFLE